MVMNMPNQVEYALNRLEKFGYESFVVGGAVRDFLLERSTSDYDITTSALPNEVIEVFKDFKVIETGIKHGTVTVIIDSMPLEITTFRVDGKYTDNRHPNSITFSKNITEDLSRRDFTINAIAYNKSLGFVDPFQGQQDILNRKIRCVGDSDKRFKEDALRIIRAIRFSSVLGFEIEEKTAKAIFSNKELLLSVSFERIYAELIKLLMGKQVANIIKKFYSVLTVVLPELSNMENFEQKTPYHIYDILTHTAISVEKAKPIPHIKLALLFHDCGKPEAFYKDEKGIYHFKGHAEISCKKAQIALNRLKTDNKTKNKVLTLIKYHSISIPPEKPIIKRLLKELTPPLFFDLLEVKKADTLAKSPNTFDLLAQLDDLKILAQNIINSKECFDFSTLDVTGDDLVSFGIPQGKKVGETLNFLLNEVIEERVDNQKAALLNHLKNKQ